MSPRLSVAAVALAALAAVAGLGVVLSSTRAERAEAYARERAAQRRAAAATRPAPAPAPVAPPREGSVCVTGVETFAVAAERALVPLPAGRQRRVAALRQLSAEAARAERTAELARPAPTLPQRMGLEDGAPVAPAKTACDGRGYAELR